MDKKAKTKDKMRKISMYSHKLTKESVLPTISARFPVSGGGACQELLMFNLFTFVNLGTLECLRASKLPRALGKIFSLVRAQYLSLIDDAKLLIKNEIEE